MWQRLFNDNLFSILNFCESFDSTLSNIGLVVFVGNCWPSDRRRTGLVIVEVDASLVALIVVVTICIAHLL
jgi:hypothetical protein